MPADVPHPDAAADLPAGPDPSSPAAGGPEAGGPAAAGGTASGLPPDSVLQDTGGLIDSLMTGIGEHERTRLLGMISLNVEAEREAALDGRVRRQVDVGPRHRSRRRDREADAERDAASSEGGPRAGGDQEAPGTSGAHATAPE